MHNYITWKYVLVPDTSITCQNKHIPFCLYIYIENIEGHKKVCGFPSRLIPTNITFCDKVRGDTEHDYCRTHCTEYLPPECAKISDASGITGRFRDEYLVKPRIRPCKEKKGYRKICI